MVVPPVKLLQGSGDAPFNMAQLFYYRLNELMAHKTRAKLYGDLKDWFGALVEIHTQISFKLNKTENDKIIADMKKIRQYLYSPMPNNKKSARQLYGMICEKCTGWLDELDRHLMHKMDVHKMIFPRIDTRSPMDTLRDDMGLRPPEEME